MLALTTPRGVIIYGQAGHLGHSWPLWCLCRCASLCLLGSLSAWLLQYKIVCAICISGRWPSLLFLGSVWVPCARVFGCTTLLAQSIFELHGIIPCFLGAFRVPLRRVFGSTKLLAQFVLEPHGSVLCFLGSRLACLCQYKVVGVIGT